MEQDLDFINCVVVFGTLRAEGPLTKNQVIELIGAAGIRLVEPEFFQKAGNLRYNLSFVCTLPDTVVSWSGLMANNLHLTNGDIETGNTNYDKLYTQIISTERCPF